MFIKSAQMVDQRRHEKKKKTGEILFIFNSLIHVEIFKQQQIYPLFKWSYATQLLN